ncbi:bifunctional allantoicase/(S)-ureidoglycine aminohydrolase [Phaeovulum vinaykumarii]|uniref:(S)-ureidoglycine aminohydrolase n=1 Tax=Phaeovulum vinaykumarii TaxID=407234 RepID=A0A1N7LVV6_9RHOB|nr:bifunctional allantoicase/(S)-ureidoglycine aminohydrolase [Phaeovulum vinaykumarii]SIS77985.1 (S)-ureidoglycine aminohydrolase [Phaeovulum vinaykumarii]SOC07213.1 (S)-ureidoglycine aminohydrolase [Phaeovulum vinaykumarii]
MTTEPSPFGPPYAPAAGGLPGQGALHTGRAVFTEAYAVLPRATMSDITASFLPGWAGTRAWIIARPLSGFAETFSHYLMEVAPGGGSETPEPEAGAEGVIFVTEGVIWLKIGPEEHEVSAGGYAYLPAGQAWRLRNAGEAAVRFHWLRKLYEPVAGIAPPAAFVTSDREVAPVAMPGTNGAWATTRFVDPEDLAHDMHVNIVTLHPGATIPFEETHVMEHGLFVLSGKGVYRLNRDWVEVEAGDYMWLRAFCPQACYAAGPGPFRYLLYKDVNRHARLRGPGAFGR